MNKRNPASTFILDFGAQDIKPIMDALQALIGQVRVEVELPSSASRIDDYSPSGLTLAQATEELASGRSHSILISSSEEETDFFALVFSPQRVGASNLWWHGLFEFKAEYSRQLFDTVRQAPGINFVSLSMEDSIDLPENAHVTEETFPWDDWRLVEAVVAGDQDVRAAKVRRGPVGERILPREA